MGNFGVFQHKANHISIMHSESLSNINMPKISFFSEFWRIYFPNIIDENTIADKFNFIAISNLGTTFDQSNFPIHQDFIIGYSLFKQILAVLIALQKLIDERAEHSYDKQFNSVTFSTINDEILILNPENGGLFIMIGREGNINRIVGKKINSIKDLDQLTILWNEFFLRNINDAIFRKKKENLVVAVVNNSELNSETFQSQNTKISFNLLCSIIDLLKKYKCFLERKKPTAVYLIRLRIEPNYIVITPELRNENYSKWGFYIAKMNSQNPI